MYIHQHKGEKETVMQCRCVHWCLTTPSMIQQALQIIIIVHETIKEPQLPKHERGLDVTLRVTRCAGRISMYIFNYRTSITTNVLYILGEYMYMFGFQVIVCKSFLCIILCTHIMEIKSRYLVTSTTAGSNSHLWVITHYKDNLHTVVMAMVLSLYVQGTKFACSSC